MVTWIAGKGTIPAITTNADRIRAMSDEEMAEWHKQMMEGYCPRQTSECPSDCYECWLDWLKQEADHV